MPHVTDEARWEKDRDQRDALWNVLVDKIRGRLGELQSVGKLLKPELKEILRNEFVATAEGAYLSVWFHPEDGIGSWNQIAPVDDCEPWSLSPTGIAELSGVCMSVHELAEAFASKLVSSDR